MIAGKYTVKDFFVNRHLKQVIVPEIQRDYVWPEEPLQGLLTSLLHGFERFHAFQPDLQLADKELAASFTAYQRRMAHSTSLGFIYAYSDAEYAGRYFLIDGQQRLTSVLLMLLALAHRNAGLREDFKRIFYADELLKFDYKVRAAAHDFLARFVPYSLKNSAEEVEQQTWHYQDAKSDVTIQSLLRNFRFLQRQFDKMDFEPFASKADREEAFFRYLTDYTEFYYFDTNLSEQGEDLYIYMNARGEQMQANENRKAELLGKLADSDKNDWGKKWEGWQDFFWQHRTTGKAKNSNADAGFNEFLTCVDGMTAFLEGSIPAEPNEEGPDKPLRNIEQYVEGLRFLKREKETFTKGYSYHAWVEECWEEIWRIFNVERSNWQADKQTNERFRVLVWPVLHFLARHKNRDAAPADAFRVLRLQYLRYHNHQNSIANLVAETTKRLGPNGVFLTDSPAGEEKLKHALYTAVGPELTKEYEAVIWEIEDHRLNQDGSSVGGINITHLVDLQPVPSLTDLRNIKDRFYELLSEGSRHLSLQNALLHYGSYQHRESPWRYCNYNFGNWKRTIRGKGSEEKASEEKETVFRRFFREFIQECVSIDEFLQKKGAIPFNNVTDLHHQVLWYTQKIGNQVWGKGPYIAFEDWEIGDLNFPGFPVIYNTWGNFMGYGNRKLQEITPSIPIA